ncbi:putative EG45-like domain containing protein 1 [Lycium ferocissimum]|uniref:putative EG45-like domain containing protein 1 n=1 Tax=Lycium ferocissimum TaxID=112874 RepID=UPI0028157F43|nr:putative EG45-like domain containing protein 1 [Lycium ferocissimum]
MTISKSILLLLLGVVTTLFSIVLATPGTATFYTSYVPSACYGSTPQGAIIAAASDPLWAGGKICGKTFNVTCTGPTNPVPHPCTGRSIVVKIVDHCPSCGGTLDLSKEAFSTIANPVAGVIKIDYAQTS